jgi:hypothetical protein
LASKVVLNDLLKNRKLSEEPGSVGPASFLDGFELAWAKVIPGFSAGSLAFALVVLPLFVTFDALAVDDARVAVPGFEQHLARIKR